MGAMCPDLRGKEAVLISGVLGQNSVLIIEGVLILCVALGLAF